jgi:hypothetical protein
MALIMAETAMIIMAMLTLKEIIENKLNKIDLLKHMKYTLGIVGGICLFFLLFGSSIFSFSSAGDVGFAHRLMNAGFPQSAVDQILDILQNHRQSMLTRDALRSLIFVILAFGLLWTFVEKKIQKANYFIMALTVLVLADMWPISKRYLNDRHFTDARSASAILPSEANLQILQDKDPNFRVFNANANTFNESQTSYFHKSIGGYSPAKLRRYQDIIDFHLSRGINIDVLNMLNTKYFIAPGGQVQHNVSALGHAWFVDSIRFVENPDEEILALNDFDPSSVAIVDRSGFGEILGNFTFDRDTTASIVLAHYQPNKLIYRTSAKTPQFAVFSEVFYRHWTAKIDGKDVPIIRVNYILRALVIPEGEHEIVFTHHWKVHTLSQRISFYTSMLIVLLVFAIGVYQFRKPKNKK